MRRRRQKLKIARLHKAGATLGDLARLARVSYRMAMFWAADEKKSSRLDEAFRKLTAAAA